MKKTVFALILMLLTLSIANVSCKKSGAASGGSGGSTGCTDPNGTVTANLRNDGGSVTILGGTLTISNANNFVFVTQYGHERLFVHMGAVDGLGCITSIPTTGWSYEVAVKPDNGYIAMDIDVGGTIKYARIYVTRYMLNTFDEIIGAELKYQDNWLTYPTVTTNEVTDITQNSAVSGGYVYAPNVTITERGICWGEMPDPTISDHHTSTSQNLDYYTLTMTGLQKATGYHVRAYIKTNTFGVVYGEDKTFATLSDPSAPQVKTYQVTNVTANSAICWASVDDECGSPVSERGVCWNTTGEPTINDMHQSNGSGVGDYTVEMTGLSGNTTYYVRAYAVNSLGVGYDGVITFTTSHEWPNGMLPEEFSVSETKRVKFSQGNLQYQASTNTFRFALSQNDCIGEDNSHISSSYSGWIDLFGWGTSGWNNGNVFYQPYSSDNVNGSWYGPVGEYSLVDEYANSDWGVYNSISNGGNSTGMWRTLTGGEWYYLLFQRQTTYDIRYAKARVNGVNGLIILPDNWNPSVYSLSYPNSGWCYYELNEISLADWPTLEVAGAVFLPAAGYRNGTSVGEFNNECSYWSASSYYNSSEAYYQYLNNSDIFEVKWDARCVGHSVRLVHNVN